MAKKGENVRKGRIKIAKNDEKSKSRMRVAKMGRKWLKEVVKLSESNMNWLKMAKI